MEEYKWKDANICMTCNALEKTSEGNGIRLFLCGKCAEEWKEKLKHYNEHGLYAQAK